jgi:succinate-semialdehyde dehydrogenase / glutarate-semialdehyde dehydrogenase
MMDEIEKTARERLGNLRLLIAGEWTRGTGSDSEAVLDPSTGDALGTLPHASEADLAAAIDAAQRGFAAWSTTPAIDRRRVLLEAGRLIRERADLIACVMTLEQGKPIAEAKAEIGGAADIFEWYAEEARRLYGRVIPARQRNVRQIVLAEPVGPVAAFTPWNFPALTPARKIAGALAAGCSCVLKPAEETPGTALELARACMDAGLPAGVLNVVFGVPAVVSGYLIRSPSIRKITFTGSIAVGKELAAMAVMHGLKRCTLELGGHAPVLVFEDADVEQAATACATARFRNAGQVCIAPSRFFVHASIQARFVARFVEVAQALRLGSGLEAATTMGPLANARRLDAMTGFVDDATRSGARVETGGARVDRAGFFWKPTVLTGLPDSARAMSEETFGPIAPITPFDSMDEALHRANQLPFGLSAYAFTRSAGTAHLVSEGLAAGMVGINGFGVSVAEAPFGGIKESGTGSEGGTEGLNAYLNTKFVSHTT